MLAEDQPSSRSSGRLSPETHRPETARIELLRFISQELPKWRDRKDRPVANAETVLTSQLCAHLNSAARHSDGWDNLQFRVEERDEVEKARKTDLVAAPCGPAIWIDGRSYTDFEAILPIECKRLPIPVTADRDDREYVFSEKSSTGGIQRFKDCHHGAAHSLGAMIAYLQSETAEIWLTQVKGWIDGLAQARQPGWSAADHLAKDDELSADDVSAFKSRHARREGCEISLRHLWIRMN